MKHNDSRRISGRIYFVKSLGNSRKGQAAKKCHKYINTSFKILLPSIEERGTMNELVAHETALTPCSRVKIKNKTLPRLVPAPDYAMSQKGPNTLHGLSSKYSMK
ncbi:hypothetical protein PoB_006731000 [Plakobranchus ocellatus]|uniref:FLYWCH-type domain-containing protein n=1 Tax=Plakobranchus ocellatus TaxID=259542 RepID=A0AAV4D9S9_9GAST|nr:hypothetical protein PoB_006731000 [Plakobranchus ocellatus]